jgi:FG-GAP repeat
VCVGVTCDDRFTEAELAIVEVRGARDVALPGAASETVQGAAEDGAEWTVASLGDRFVLGETGPGRLVFLDIAATDTSSPLAVVEAQATGSQLGTSLVVVPGSGGLDLWVGAPGLERAAGAVLRFTDAGSLTGDLTTDQADLVLNGSTPDDQLGSDVFLCGDLTGDGLPELVVTAPLFVPPADWAVADPSTFAPLAGAVFLVTSELADEAGGVFEPGDLGPVYWGASAGAGAGAAVLCDTDIDGDGQLDLVIGSPWANDGRGQVHAMSASSPLPPSGPLGGDPSVWLTLDGTAGAWFGRSLAALPVDGGTFLAIGGPGYADGAGRVELYRGTDLSDENIPLPQALVTVEAGVAGSGAPHFGRWLAAGDLDGDSEAELVVGAPQLDGLATDGTPLVDTGQIWVWYDWAPPDTELVLSADDAPLRVLGTRGFQEIGRAMLLADHDQDGVNDLWVPTRDRGTPTP